MTEHVFVCGYPSDVGGANTELWHTLQLWRQFALPVTLIPTWKTDQQWRSRLEGIGCRTVESNPDNLTNVSDLAGGVVVSMCNTKFLAAAGRFRELNCKIIWVGCMNWLFPQERMHYRQCGLFDRHVFQSRYQHDQLVPQLRKYGYDDHQGRVIRGAFAIEEFPFRPLSHASGEAFTIGRISRAKADKFSPRTWQIYHAVPHPLRARVLGWAEEVRARLGPPPGWAQCLPAGNQTPQVFLATLHAIVHSSGPAVENWPRVGLEAMAAGVPLVVDNHGGWREMIRHGETGYLCNTDEQFAYYTARLAYDEKHRVQIARQARECLKSELADPRTIWAGWQALFSELA